MSSEEKMMLYNLLIKMAEDLKAHNMSKFAHSWYEFKDEVEFFKSKLAELKMREDEND